MLQGAKVLEDRELRFRLRQVTVDPAEPASTVVIKYTGVLGTPEWMDIERGSVIGFNNFVRGVEVKQTSSRSCATYGRTHPLLRIRQGAENQAKSATCGISM